MADDTTDTAPVTPVEIPADAAVAVSLQQLTDLLAAVAAGDLQHAQSVAATFTL